MADRLFLVVYSNGAEGNQILVPPGSAAGREQTCNVMIDDPDAEDFHCQFDCEAGGWFVRDCISQAGTRVNGERIRKKKLKSGDTIDICTHRFEVLLKTSSSIQPLADGNLAVPGSTTLDRKLIAAVVDGSPSSWGKLYERHRNSLLRFCNNFTADPETAEEWVHETFVRLKEKAGTFQPDADVKPWLFRIARNICLQDLRKQKVFRWSDSVAASLPMAITDPDPTPASRAVAAELTLQAKEMLQELSEDERTVFILKYIEGMSRKEIAKVMETPEATVKSRLHRAMNILRRKTGNY